MKAYGLTVIECPDVGDIHEMGAKSSAGRFRKKGGDYDAYCDNVASKGHTRRFWKRKARREALNDIRAAMSEEG